MTLHNFIFSEPGPVPQPVSQQWPGKSPWPIDSSISFQNCHSFMNCQSPSLRVGWAGGTWVSKACDEEIQLSFVEDMMKWAARMVYV